MFPLNSKMSLNPGFALRLRVEWDTGEEYVELPDVIVFSAEEVKDMIEEIEELVDGEEDEREQWTNHVIVGHLEALTDWMVESWEIVE